MRFFGGHPVHVGGGIIKGRYRVGSGCCSLKIPLSVGWILTPPLRNAA